MQRPHSPRRHRLFLLLMTAALVFTACAGSPTPQKAEPREPSERTISLINYNVAGLPKIFGNQAEDVGVNQEKIGAQLAARDFDIVAVQEDFGYHKQLLSGLGDAYEYRTVHSGGVPGGDGLNLYSRYPLYNETRTPWEAAYGIIEDGADEMTPKGILYALIALENGVYLDFYDIHADAYGDTGSAAAREVQFKQLAAILQNRTHDRPVIVTGDFNTSIHLDNDSGLYDNLMAECGLTDVWIALYNNGDTEDFSAHFDSSERWDGIEKVLFRSGGGVELEPLTFAYEWLTDEDGTSLSDHPAAVCSFSYTLTADFVPVDEPMSVTDRNVLSDAVNKLRYLAADLWKIFSNADQLWNYIKPGLENFLSEIRELLPSPNKHTP